MPRVSTSVLDWLAREHHSRCALTRDVPGSPRPLHEWIGPRLIWWPRGIPPGERVGIVSSRLGSLGKLGPHWFAALRQICRDMDADRQLLVTAQGTALDELLNRCARLFHMPLVRFELARQTWSLARWLAECMARDVDDVCRDGACWPALVSPPLHDAACSLIPARDAIVVAASDRIIACRVRRGGNICQLLERRLAEACPSGDPHVTVLVGDGFVGRQVGHALVAKGATWLETKGEFGAGSALAEPVANWPTMDEIPMTDYLTHCTRGTDGPWPDQDRAEYLNDLILGRPDAAHSALSALTRIVQQRRLLATGRAIRGSTPVVCFTAAAIAELQRLHTFRSHRRRWDFEPYGISVARDWLQRQGGQPVVYGDDALWNTLAEDERPYFQRQYCGKDGTIDWSVEREWRHVGDVDLDSLPPGAGFVFVPSRAEAARLAGLSRWPVVVVPS